MEQWIEEVLFRGRPPSGEDSEKPPRFHVIFGVQETNPLTGEKVRSFVGPVDAATAASYGYTPQGLVEAINLQAFNQITDMEAQIAALEEERQALATRVEALEKSAAAPDAEE